MNHRPDAPKDKIPVYLGIKGAPDVKSLEKGEKLYLTYDKKLVPSRYQFSKGNAPSSLWIEVEPDQNEAIVNVKMLSDKDTIIDKPDAFAQFKLPQKEFSKVIPTSKWEIDKWKVDNTLLSKQKFHWFGQDVFLEKHGGLEYDFSLGKERLDIGQGNDLYFCFVAEGDCLIWEKSRWVVQEPSENTREKPLLHVKKISEKNILFELWDPEGKSKITLNLPKSQEAWAPHAQIDFKFIGARTRSQCILEIGGERVSLRPQDWLILTNFGWQKISQEEDIDDYVSRRLIGPLFVFDKIMKKEERHLLFGTLYNGTRSAYKNIELPLQNSVGTVSSANEEEKQQESEIDAKSENFKQNLETFLKEGIEL